MSKKIKLDYFKNIVLPDLNASKLYVNEFSPSCFRITNGINSVDYFPKSNRIFIHKTQAWGDVTENVIESIKNNLQ